MIISYEIIFTLCLNSHVLSLSLILLACDVRISSGVKKTGTLSSPGYPDYPLPANVTCNYYLDGMKNNEVLEKVEIYFKDFDIPGRMP